MFHEMNLPGSPFERVSASPLCIPVHNIEYFHSAVGRTCCKPFSVVVELRIVLILGVNCGVVISTSSATYDHVFVRSLNGHRIRGIA